MRNFIVRIEKSHCENWEISLWELRNPNWEISLFNHPILSYLSYRIVSPILSYPILSYPILSYPILSYPILSYPILSYPILSYPILSYPILSYPILSYPILSYPILSYPILSYPILSYPILSYPIKPVSAFGPGSAVSARFTPRPSASVSYSPGSRLGLRPSPLQGVTFLTLRYVPFHLTWLTIFASRIIKIVSNLI